MAESGVVESSGQSLYMHKTIQQVSSDDRVTVGGREASGFQKAPSLSIDLKATSTFGNAFRLMCAVCLQDLKQPKQLKSCYHIFCRDCLQPYMEEAVDGEMICPCCGLSCALEDISSASSGAVRLNGMPGPISSYVESSDVSCRSDHHLTPALASSFCLECGKNLCDVCLTGHSAKEEFQHHNLLRLFRTPSTQTVEIHRLSDSLDAASLDDVSSSFKCPICRNSDVCSHEKWLKDLSDVAYSQNELCPIPEHASGNKLIAFCPEPCCNEPICRNCSMIQHKAHETVNIGEAVKDRLPELKSVKKMLVFQEEIFRDAAVACEKAERDFREHVLEVEQEAINRKGSVHSHVENAINDAFRLVEQMGRKLSELNRQSEDMQQEQNFLRTAIRLADKGLEKGASPVQVVRTWKGLSLIKDGLDWGAAGKKDTAQEPEAVVPQVIMEKRLVLPAPCVVSPDLSILHKVGVENTVLQLAFCLKAEPELLLFYSILPLTHTEALLACNPSGGSTEVVQYSCLLESRPSTPVAQGGEVCLAAVPGRGVLLTLNQPPSTTSSACSEGKKQVLFWSESLGVMTDSQMHRAPDSMKELTSTKLPPRGLEVTKDSHVVVLTAANHSSSHADPPRSAESLVLLMTLQGDVVRKTNILKCPRYVTVNINDDICVTDEEDRAVIILDRALQITHRFVNPYNSDRDNSRFCPRGICHDSFGRLIVADPNNNTVLRIEYDAGGSEPLFSTILKNNLDGITDLDCPILVAMSPGLQDHGPRLWVVCRSNIHVFDYMEKE